jgi:hypothetical protein
MTDSKIIERIEREVRIPGLAAQLADRLPPSDLQSLLLEVYSQMAHRQKPSDVLADYETNRFVRPGKVSPAKLIDWERTAFANLPSGFPVMALSPVCPLGTSSAIASVDQDWVLSTIRNTEVVSDSTNVLALECALQRRRLLRENPKSKATVHLAANHRLLRTQHYANPGLASHFSAIALCSAGQDQGNLHFELATLALHIGYYLRSLRAFLGSELPMRVSVADYSSTDRRAHLTARLFAPIQEEFTNATCVFDDRQAGGRGYYAELRFHIHATAPSGGLIELVDGGLVNWTQTLLSNAKERCVISGIGSERVCTEFGASS